MRVALFVSAVWCRGLFNEPAFRRQLYANEAGSTYAGASGYNLGGRSIFWGAFAPRMRAWEFTEGAWPAAVRDDLLRDGGYFDRAEALLKVVLAAADTTLDAYLALCGRGSAAEFGRLLEMKRAGRTTAAAAPTAAVAVSVGSGEEGPLQQTAASEGCRRARCSAQISLDAPASALCVPFRS